MAAHKLGHCLFRCTAPLRSDRLLWQSCSFQGLRGNFLAHGGQLHAGLSCFLTAAQTGRSPAGYRGNAVRFYSRDGAGWQGLSGAAGQSLSSQNPGDATDFPSPAAVSVAAAVTETTERTVPFYVQLKECHSPADVLDLAGRYTMTLRRVSSSLSRIWETTKKMSEEQRRYERQLMLDHPAFEQLCACAVKGAARMRSDDLTFSLLAVVKLGMPQRSRLVQTLLRATQEKLNEFDEKALSVLAAFLGDMKSCKNVDALRNGLRLVVEDRVSGIESVVALQNLMRCVGRDAPLTLKRKLENKALSMVDQFSLPNAQYMVITLAAMHFTSKPLLDICSKKIAESIHTIPPFRLMDIVKACKDLRYRDPHLFSAVAEHLTAIFDMWSNKQLILFLLMFEDLKFRPVALLDRLLERVIQDPNSLTLKDVLSVLKVYSQLNHVPENHKQEFLERMTSVLESYLLKMAPTDLLRGVFSLCILGHFPLAPLERLLHRETLDELTKGGQVVQTNQRRLHYVDLCLKLDRPPLPEALTVPPGTIDPPLTSQTVTRDWGKLIQRIAGDAVLQEGVVLEKSYFIDCVITLPLKRTDLSSPSEGERASPEPRQRVAVLFAPPSFFCLGTSHPRGRLVMMMRHLRALGYTPVLLPEQEFDVLSEEERAERLKSLIFPAKEEVGAV
ncbi:FAST kinase domain-containing protein 2, mitochondrial isoform X1 [Anguilla anguilla]|uniref:FAST kinase domain-containing protein 2, mitochondrial isoform X1 n=1 Tax=Anguilla anguilla TaxID=7936 RepID=UPI0015B37445|nr:FAST kinase domain-containing protein 2, mitochondrial isoform X1 [Anguilla anguilla]